MCAFMAENLQIALTVVLVCGSLSIKGMTAVKTTTEELPFDLVLISDSMWQERGVRVS